MRNLLEKITLPEARTALLKSGYLLESRLETVLRSLNYFVDANVAYPDPYIGKQRELDLSAIGGRRAGPGESDYVFTVFLIECINNPQPIVFITKDPQVGFLHHYELKIAGLPVKILENRDSWLSLSEYLGMDKYHHYCKGRIATQFCSFIRKKPNRDWMALHEETHFDAFQKLTAAVEYYMDKHFKSWVFGKVEPVNIEFYYPVVVLQGQLLEASHTNRGVRLTKVDHIQYRRSIISRDKKEQEDYQIDVVTERFFSRYLQLIEGEQEKTRRLISRRHADIRKAIDKITGIAQKLRNPDKIRKAMEF